MSHHPRFAPGTPCTKCGDRGAATTYIAHTDLMRRRCHVCGYEWTQTPLDRADREARA